MSSPDALAGWLSIRLKEQSSAKPCLAKILCLVVPASESGYESDQSAHLSMRLSFRAFLSDPSFQIAATLNVVFVALMKLGYKSSIRSIVRRSALISTSAIDWN